MEDAIKSLATHLRIKAEKLLKNRPHQQTSHPNEGEILKLLHELEVYSVELELQNEELLMASSDAVEVAEKNKFSENVKQRIIHEFEVNQIELEMLNEELQLSNVVSKDVAERYSDLFNFSSSGYLILSKEGEILDLNFTGARLLRKDRYRLKNSMFGFFVADEYKPRYNDFIRNIFITKSKSVCEVSLVSEDSKTIDVQLTGILTQNVEQCLMTVVDITEANQITKYRNLTREILQILNEPGTLQDSIHRTLSLLKTSTGFDAVSIRMQDGDDFPYTDQSGFSSKFISSENSLLELDKNGAVCLDKNGRAALACNCGLVLSGELNSELESVTDGGSWWTNDSSQIPEVGYDKNKRCYPRKKCIEQGYSSIALVPIRTNDKIVGLIQFNNFKKDSYNINKIESLEGIATHIGATIKQKQAEEKLRKNEELLRTITENAPDIIIQLDQQGTILYMNRSLPGYSIENCLGKNFCEWTFPEYHALMNQSLELVFKDSSTQTYLSKGDDNLGNERWYRTNISPVKDGVKVINAILITRDITESILNEEIIKESEAKRTAIIETSMDGFWIFDRRGCFLEVNETYCRKSGYSKQELLTMQIQDIEVRENEVDIATHLQRIIELGEIRYEGRHRRKDGSIMEIGTNIQYRPAKGGQFVAFVHDISKRKQQEKELFESNEQFRLLFENSLDAILFTNPDGTISSVNPEAERMFGKSEAEIISLKRNDLSDPNDPRLKHSLEERKKTGRFKGELNYLRKDGTSFPVEITSTIFKDANGIERSGIIARDIFERKQAEQKIIQSEVRYRSLFDTMIEGYSLIEMIFDENKNPVDYLFLETNSTYEEQCGLKDVVGKLMRDINPELEDFWFDIYAKVALTGEMMHFENESRALNKWFEVRASKIGDEESLKVAVCFNDITKRKKAEMLLQTNNSRLKLAMQSGNMAWWEMDIPTGNVIFDDRKTEMLGYLHEDFTNYRDFMKLVHPDDADRCMNAMRIHYKGLADKYEVEYRILTKSGEYLWCSDIGTITKRDENGTPLSITGIAYNINERKLAEEKSQLNYTRLTLAMKVSNMAWWEMNIATGNISFEKRKAEMLGYNPANFTHYTDFMKLVHPDDAKRAMSCMSKHIHGTAEKYEVEYRILAKSGEYKWFYDIGSVTTRDSNGKSLIATGLVMNITERKKAEILLQQSEDRFRLALKNSPVSVAVQDKNFVYNWAYNYKNLNIDEIIGKTDADLFAPEDLPSIMEVKRRVIELGTEEHIQTWINSNSQREFLDIHYEPVKDSAGVTIGIGIAKVNLTQQKLAELELQDYIKAQDTLSLAATALLSTMPYSELTMFAVQQIQQIAANSIVILSEFDSKTEQSIIRSMSGNDSKIDKMEAMIGKPLTGLSFQFVNDIWQPIDINCLTPIVGGLYNLCFRQIPQEICLQIETELQIKTSYVMPLSVENDIMGSMVIFVESTNELPNKTLIETFIKQISLTLKSIRIKEELSRSRTELDIALANMTDAVFISDAQGQYIHINEAFATFHKFNNLDECNKVFAENPKILEVNWFDSSPVPIDMRAVPRALRGETATNVEYRLKRKDTGETWVGSYSFSPIRNNDNDIVGSVVVARDITDIKLAQEVLSANEERYSLIYNSSRDGIFSMDMSGRLTSVNRSFCEEFNLELSQLIGHTFKDVGLNGLLCQELENLKNQVLETDNSNTLEMSLPLSEGIIRHYELILNPLHDDKLNIVGFGGSSRNITKRRESNQALIESEKRFRFLVKDMPVGVILYGSDSEVVMTNPKALELLAINKDQLVGSASLDSGWNMIHEDGSTLMKSNQPVEQVLETLQSVQDVVIGIIRPNSNNTTWILKDTEILLKADCTVRNVVCSLIDITERKEKEEALRKLNMTLAALGKSSQAMSQPLDELDYLNKVCNIIVEDTTFPMVWIGYAEYDEAKSIRPVASAGFVDNYLEVIKLSWDDSEYGRGPTGAAIRTGTMRICNNMATDPAFEPWREEALKRGYASSIVFPLITGDITFGAITIYSREPDSFLEDEIKLLSKLASDLAHGITSIRLLAAHQIAENALIKSHDELEKTVKERTVELQESNEILKVTEEKYRTVADFATNWEFWIASDDEMIYCSPSCVRTTGYSVADFVSNPHLIYDIIHPEELKEYEEHRENEKTASKCDHEIQFRIIKKDGSFRWIGHYCRPVYDESGTFKGTRGSNKDITARKKMEELLIVSNQKYKLLSANINDGIFICKNARFEYVNNAFYDIFGYTEKELIKMKLTQLVTNDYHEELENFLYTTASINKSCVLEVECLRNDLSVVFVEILLNYVAKDKTVYGVVHDITEKKEFQKNMVKAIIQTEETERSHFSKELHDGLGPLLSTIKLYLQWSERPNSNKSREEIIGKAGEILEEALTTVKEISTKLSPHLLTNYGLSSAIKSFVDKLSATASYNIVFESNSTRRVDVNIETALYRAIIECINNTIKYAKATNIEILLTDTGSQIQLHYKDDGAGFDITTTIAEHKGLGLFNLQNRLHTIGGKVDLKSEPGKGVDYMFTVNI